MKVLRVPFRFTLFCTLSLAGISLLAAQEKPSLEPIQNDAAMKALEERLAKEMAEADKNMPVESRGKGNKGNRPEGGIGGGAGLGLLFSRADRNGNGKIDPDELNAVKTEFTPKLEQHAKLKERLLQHFDINRNGQLDDDEWQKMAAAAEKAHDGGGDLRAKALEKFDTDKDGKLSEAERAAMQEALSGKRKKKE